MTAPLTSPRAGLEDVVIVGGGLSGTIAAVVLGRAGYAVTLIDRHAVHPPDFRAEHLDEPQRDLLARLGVLDGIVAGVPLVDTVVCCRRGRILDGNRTINYGMPYEAMVNAARRLLPGSVKFLTGRVTEIDPGPMQQNVTLADGRRVTGRLAVLATGFGYALSSRLGIQRQSLRDGQTMTIGFDISFGRGAPRYPFLVHYGELADRIDYLTAFRMGDRTRVNIFGFRDYRDPWTRRFIDEPDTVLQQILPGLGRLMNPFRVSSEVQIRMTEVRRVEGHLRDGIVLIGDAFQTSCPAAGNGITRLLSDVERLCTVHAPAWLATPGMAAEKIAQFYYDPVKLAFDQEGLHRAAYRQAVSTETSLGWTLHRGQVMLRRRVRGWIKGPPPRHPVSAGPPALQPHPAAS